VAEEWGDHKTRQDRKKSSKKGSLVGERGWILGDKVKYRRVYRENSIDNEEFV